MRPLRIALRNLRKDPGFALSALVILVLGIGANTAIFSIVNAVLLKPLPYPEPDSIVTLYHVPPQQSFPGMKRFVVSPANYLDWRDQNTVFESIAAIGGRTARVSGTGRPQLVTLTVTVPDFFKTLRMAPHVGRSFTAAECEPGHDDVIVLTQAFAAKQFGGSLEALGQSIELNGRTLHVIGVLPPEFELKSWFPTSSDGVVPLAWTSEDTAVRRDHNYVVVARLRPGVTVSSAQTEMNVISDGLAKRYPEADKGWGAIVQTLQDDLVGDVRPALLILLAAVSFVLLIACANTANLVLSRAVTRQKELAIRAALGASSAQILRHGITETMLLAAAGRALGLL